MLWYEDSSSKCKCGRENAGAQRRSARYRANTKETCYQKVVAALNLACSSLQMVQEEIEVLEVAPGDEHNVVILLEVKRWLINCTCL